MKFIFTVISLAVLLALSDVHAGEVIAHPSVNLTADEIRDLFLGERRFAGNVKLAPVDNIALHSEFLSKVLQTDERKYFARWTRKSFREGLAAPALMSGDAEVAAFVKATPGAVGYVTKGADGVKVLQKF